MPTIPNKNCLFENVIIYSERFSFHHKSALKSENSICNFPSTDVLFESFLRSKKKKKKLFGNKTYIVVKPRRLLRHRPSLELIFPNVFRQRYVDRVSNTTRICTHCTRIRGSLYKPFVRTQFSTAGGGRQKRRCNRCREDARNPERPLHGGRTWTRNTNGRRRKKLFILGVASSLTLIFSRATHV